jgi:hypothetical protein
LAGVSEVHRELVKRCALPRAGRPHEQDVAVGENLFEQQTLEVGTRDVQVSIDAVNEQGTISKAHALIVQNV